MISLKLSEKLVYELKDKFHKDLHSVILFGSYAKGKAQEYSDIDILIILNRQILIFTPLAEEHLMKYSVLTDIIFF